MLINHNIVLPLKSDVLTDEQIQRIWYLKKIGYKNNQISFKEKINQEYIDCIIENNIRWNYDLPDNFVISRENLSCTVGESVAYG